MDTMTIVIIVVVAIVVLALLGLALQQGGKRRKDRHAGQAEELRAQAREQVTGLGDERAAARAAEEQAEQTRLEADRAERMAREKRGVVDAHEAETEDQVRAADKLDPEVDHKADDYSPHYDRALRDPEPDAAAGHVDSGSHERGQRDT